MTSGDTGRPIDVEPVVSPAPSDAALPRREGAESEPSPIARLMQVDASGERALARDGSAHARHVGSLPGEVLSPSLDLVSPPLDVVSPPFDVLSPPLDVGASPLDRESLFLDPPRVLAPRDRRSVADASIGAARRAWLGLRSLLDLRLSLAFVLQSSLAFGVAHFLLFNLSVVRGSSMSPGIHDGDRIVIDNFAYWFTDVTRGDVVVLKYPLDPSVDYIKRVIGVPGDEVTLEDGRVWVNGELLPEPYVVAPDALARTTVLVKPAHYFVLGDNRPRSSDSRDFGQVPRDYIRGRVEVRLWPLERVGAVE